MRIKVVRSHHSQVVDNRASGVTIRGTLRQINRRPQWLWRWVAGQEIKTPDEFFQPEPSPPRFVRMIALGPISLLIGR
jgi:hypothetical protein